MDIGHEGSNVEPLSGTYEEYCQLTLLAYKIIGMKEMTGFCEKRFPTLSMYIV